MADIDITDSETSSEPLSFIEWTKNLLSCFLVGSLLYIFMASEEEYSDDEE